MTELILLRHAQTEWSEAKKHTGRTDLPLTDAGRAAAEQLHPVFAGREFALALTSPLQRAAVTAELAGIDAEPDDDLVEWDYGDYEGKTATEIRRERPGWVLWTDGAPNGERPEDVAARADRVIERALGADGPVVLVAHGHLLRTVAVRWLEQPMPLGERLQLAPGHLGVLGVERATRVLRAWSATLLP